MKAQSPAIIAVALLLALVAYIMASEEGGVEVTLYSQDVRLGGSWHHEAVPSDHWVGVILDREAWDRLPAEIGRADIGASPSPAPDFDEFVAVVAYMGAMPTGGHAIGIQEVTFSPGEAAAPDQVRIRLEVMSPDPGAMVTQAFTYPAAVVQIPRTAWPDGSLKALSEGNTVLDALDQDGRNWGPVHISATL